VGERLVRMGSRDMSTLRNLAFATTASTAVCGTSHADVADTLEQYIGYTIVASKTIDGFHDKNGKTSADFEGCDFGRKIKFDDNTTLTCSTFSYTYSYRPTAVILMKSSESQGRKFAAIVMIVGDEAYDMEPILAR
jgi:hypothetical protein